MKKVVLLFIVSLLLAVNSNSFAQKGKSNEGFYFTEKTGIDFGHPGKTISLGPTVGLAVGYSPFKFLNLDVELAGLNSFSPAFLDSSLKIIPGDTANGIPDKAYYKRHWDKCSVLMFDVGFNAGTKLFCGVNTGFGVAFAEIKDKLGTFPVWNLSLEGGYYVSKNFQIFLNSSISYLWKNKTDVLKSDGSKLNLALGLRFHVKK